MKLQIKNLNSENVIELLNIRNEFLQNDNIDEAHAKLMKDIVTFFDVDRIYIAMKTGFQTKCSPVVEYIKDKSPHFYGDISDFGGYTKFIDIDITKTEEDFINLINKKNYFTGDDFEEILPIITELGYITSNKINTDIKECIVFCIKNNKSFSIMLIERYAKRDLLFSDLEKIALTDIYNAMKIKIEKETLEERIYNEVNMKNMIFENENMPMCMVESFGNKIIFFNDKYKQFVPEVYLNANYYDIMHKEGVVDLENDNEALLLKSDGEHIKYWIKKVTQFKLADDTEVYMVYIKDSADYIKQLESIDLLTSAYSLKGFSDCCKKLLYTNVEQEYVLCTLDVSKFKYINDSLGFEVGNQLLKKISDVLNKFIRSQEAYCRMHEDKFAFIFQCNSKEEIKGRINGLFSKLEAMKSEVAGYEDTKITYACGVTNVERGVEPNVLIDRANMARKTVKGSHENIISFFDEEAEKRLKDEVTIETRVSKAVDNGEFIPYLQPKFNLKTMEICGAEALVRWITPTGMIFPDSFIPLFEKNGFINTLDFIIYQKVMEHIRSCLDRGLKVYPISLNVSRNHIQNKNFVNQIMDLINKYEIPIELLELEITESIFVEDREVLKFFVENIKRPKIKVSIDDFGTAYSSLQILKDIDMDILKIDKGFLENIDFSDSHKFTKDEVVLKNIINLARDLDCQVICEGIETENQITLLQSIGCEFGQGYVFAKPMPIADYEREFLQK